MVHQNIIKHYNSSQRQLRTISISSRSQESIISRWLMKNPSWLIWLIILLRCPGEKWLHALRSWSEKSKKWPNVHLNQRSTKVPWKEVESLKTWNSKRQLGKEADKIIELRKKLIFQKVKSQILCLKDMRKWFQECETIKKPKKDKTKLKQRRLEGTDTTNKDLLQCRHQAS